VSAGTCRTILLIVSDAYTQELLLSRFKDDPRCDRVAGADSLARGLDMARRLPPDVLLIDYRVRDETCTTALPQLRASLPDALIVVHDASRDALGDDVLQLSADLILEKGRVSLASLVDLILRAASSERLALEL